MGFLFPGTKQTVLNNEVSVKRALNVLYLYLSGSPEWGVPLQKSHGYVPPQRVWILGLIGLKTGTNLTHAFWSGIGHGFRGSYGSV